MSLRPLGFVRWIAPRHPVTGILLLLGLMMAYGIHQLQYAAMHAALQAVNSILEVDAVAVQMDVSILDGEVTLKGFEVDLEGEPVLVTREIVVDFDVDWERLGVDLKELRVLRPDLYLTRDAARGWNLARILDTDAIGEGGGGSGDVALPPLNIVDGKVILRGPTLREPLAFEDVDFEVRYGDDGSLAFTAGARMGLAEEAASSPTTLVASGAFEPGETWTARTLATLEGGRVETFRALLGPVAKEASGSYRARVEMAGDAASPRIDSSLEIADVVLRLHEGSAVEVPAAAVRLAHDPDAATSWTLTSARFGLESAGGEEVEGRDLEAVFALSATRIEVTTLTFAAGDGSFTGSGSIPAGTEGALALSLEAQALPIATLTDPLGLKGFRTRGLVGGSVKVGGTLEAPEATVRIDARGLEVDARGPAGWATLGFDTVAARARGDAGSLRLESFEARRGRARITASGPLPYRDVPGDIRARVIELPLDLPVALTGVERLKGARGALTASVRMRGTTSALDVTGRLEAGSLKVPGVRGPLEVAGLKGPFSLRSQAGHLQAKLSALKAKLWGDPTTASVSVKDGVVEATVETRGLPVQRALAYAGLEAVAAEGKVRSSSTVKLDAAGLHATGTLEVPSLPLVIGGAAPVLTTRLEGTSIRYRLVPEGGGTLHVEKAGARVFGGAVEATGSVVLSTPPRVGLDLAVKALDARKFSDGLGREDVELGGTVMIGARLEGTSEAPNLSGDIAWETPRLTAKLGEKAVSAFPDRLGGRFELNPQQARAGPLAGELAGGPFEMMAEVGLADLQHPWRLSLDARDVDLTRAVKPYLDQPHQISGTASANLLLFGKGGDRSRVNGAGKLELAGRIDHLEALDKAEVTYKLRKLRDIEITKLEATIACVIGKLHFKNVVARTSHGSAEGSVRVGLDGELSGDVKVALDRGVLQPGHALLASLEGGDWFNFNLNLSGTLLEPDYNFQTKISGAALIGGAVFFAPVMLFKGLKCLFGGCRRRRRRRPPPPPPPPGSSSPGG